MVARLFLAGLLLAATSSAALAADTATISVPSSVSFGTISNINSAATSIASVSISSIKLAGNSSRLHVELKALAAAFTPPAGTNTYQASDVSWNSATWSGTAGGNGVSGTLNSTAFQDVGVTGTAPPNNSTFSTTNLTFTLAARSTINRAGAYTLSFQWKVESL